MLAIIILEDNAAEREIIQQMIENRIQINETSDAYDARVVLSTGKPRDVLAYIEQHQSLNYLAFLDIDLKTSLDGIEVASRIKT